MFNKNNLSKSKGIKTLLVALPLSLLLTALPVHAASYTVTSGDSLYQIGSLFNTSTGTIMQSNNLTSSTLYPGQILNISCGTYTVKSGDSLYLIALKYGISLNSLRKANNQWNDSIYPGQVLNLPGISSSSSQASSTATSRGTNTQGVISYTSSDLDLLARLINAEAQGQPYNAMVGVGAVVVNRVKSGQFASTISGVIYEQDNGYYQFTPVENGWINQPATQDAINAAYDALHGSDPSNGALFYFDDSATNSWLWSKPITARFGKMVFVY